MILNNHLFKRVTLYMWLFLTLFFLLNACGKKPPEDVQELSQLMNLEGSHSLQLIDEARDAGEINRDAALVYKMYAIYGDDRLPEAYHSSKKFRNADEVVAHIRLMMNELNPDTQDKLAPFFRRPDDPESYFNLKYADGSAGVSGAWVPSAHAQRPDANIYTESLLSADGKARIHYPSRSVTAKDYSGNGSVQVTSAQSRKIAEQVKGFLDDDLILDQFESLMGRKLVSDANRGGDGKFDIYIAPAGGDLGLTYCEGTKPCSAYLIINSNIGLNRKRVLRTTLAHEIFHAYQYAFKYSEPKDDWWSEATAVWAEDYIYPGDNTEQDWLNHFIPYPDTSLFDQNKPTNHHYGAYIFPYFYSENYGDDYMKETWKGCESGDCLKAVDQVIDGGFKKQWKEFTMWNYNKEPAKKYTDINGFKDYSSDVSSKTGQVMITGDGDEKVSVGFLDPLTAYLTDVINIADHDRVKKLKFKDLKNFKDTGEATGLKALIYYENGKKVIEDWTNREERSFCIENKEERFAHIMLIFSNGDRDEATVPADIKVEGTDNCYHISQENDRTAVMHFPYADRGTMKVVDINTTIETNSYGEPAEDAAEGQEYGYLTKWKVRNEFEQIKEAFTFECDGSSIDYSAGWTTRSAGDIIFDLGPEGLSEDNTFSVSFDYGFPHPNGNYEDVPDVNIQCVGLGIGATQIDLSSLRMMMEDIWQGRIYDMSEEGAKIEIYDSCLYNDCSLQTGEKFQTISQPVILQIKKSGR